MDDRGRPTLFREEYCKDFIEHAKNGGSLHSFPAYLFEKYPENGHKVHRDTVYHWAKIHPTFSDAVKLGDAIAQQKYEQIGLAGMTGTLRRAIREHIEANGRVTKEYEPAHFNAAIWIFTMKNRFGYKDAIEFGNGGPGDEQKSFSALARSLREGASEAGLSEPDVEVPEGLPLPHRESPGCRDVTPKTERTVPPIEQSREGGG
jgi:hypothetical protein